MFATLIRAAGVFFFVLTCPFEKKHVFVIFCVFWSTFGQYWSIFVRTYLPYGTAYCTVLRKVLYERMWKNLPTEKRMKKLGMKAFVQRFR